MKKAAFSSYRSKPNNKKGLENFFPNPSIYLILIFWIFWGCGGSILSLFYLAYPNSSEA